MDVPSSEWTSRDRVIAAAVFALYLQNQSNIDNSYSLGERLLLIATQSPEHLEMNRSRIFQGMDQELAKVQGWKFIHTDHCKEPAGE